MIIRICLLVVFIGYLNGVAAQRFSGIPSSVRWKQINTDTARIIFDAPATAQAERIATVIHKMAAGQHNSLGSSLKKINIVLHSNTTIANGYVGLAPFRSEYYLIPGSNIFEFGNIPWSEHLAVHEYRHVQQYNNFNRGLTKAFSFVLGEEGQAIANGLTIPAWFFEGDAVHAETALTSQGRGRLPLFLSGYNSLWLQNKNYPLSKLLNGSLKDYVPNYYRFGYLVVNYGYLKYGEDFWGNVMRDASAFKGLINSYQRAIKRYSGIQPRTLYTDALNFYKQQLTQTDMQPKAAKTVSNIYFPQYVADDSLLYVKDAYNKLAAFYIRDGRGEKKIKRKNISNEEWFSYRGGVIAYTAYDVDARWQLRDYSNIILLDVATKAEKKLTKKEKYFTPDIAPSGNHIIAVRINDSNVTALHLLDIGSGKIQKKITAPPNTFFSNPRFIDEHNIVAAIRYANGTMSLASINLLTNEQSQLIPPSFTTIGFPFVYDSTLYMTGSLEGNDDLYAVRLNDKKLYRLTSGQTGNYFASVFKDTVLWSNFTADGLQLQKKELKEMVWKELDSAGLQKQAITFPVANATASILTTPTRGFSVSAYKKSTGLFNFHSRRPFYEDPEFTFSLYSDNVLNTFSNRLIYRYNQNEQSHGAGITTLYGGLYPILSSGFEYTFNRHIKTTARTLIFDQLEARAGYSIPLNFTQGKTYKFLNVGSNYVFNRLLPKGFLKDSITANNVHYGHHFVQWTYQLPRAVQHIFPKFGYTFSLNYRHRFVQKGYQSLGSGQVFLPSFANHSLVLAGGFQQTDTSNIVFTNRFANSRGYKEYFLSKMWRASANYHLPLAYPDFGINGLFYIVRVRTNLFYDFTKVYSRDKLTTRNLRSTGAELYFDTSWGAQVPVSFGVRYSYLLDNELMGKTRKHRFALIIPMNIIPN